MSQATSDQDNSLAFMMEELELEQHSLMSTSKSDLLDLSDLIQMRLVKQASRPGSR
jgi:hypothetical protein